MAVGRSLGCAPTVAVVLMALLPLCSSQNKPSTNSEPSLFDDLGIAHSILYLHAARPPAQPNNPRTQSQPLESPCPEIIPVALHIWAKAAYLPNGYTLVYGRLFIDQIKEPGTAADGQWDQPHCVLPDWLPELHFHHPEDLRTTVQAVLSPVRRVTGGIDTLMNSVPIQFNGTLPFRALSLLVSDISKPHHLVELRPHIQQLRDSCPVASRTDSNPVVWTALGPFRYLQHGPRGYARAPDLTLWNIKHHVGLGFGGSIVFVLPRGVKAWEANAAAKALVAAGQLKLIEMKGFPDLSYPGLGVSYERVLLNSLVTLALQPCNFAMFTALIDQDEFLYLGQKSLFDTWATCFPQGAGVPAYNLQRHHVLSSQLPAAAEIDVWTSQQVTDVPCHPLFYYDRLLLGGVPFKGKPLAVHRPAQEPEAFLRHEPARSAAINVPLKCGVLLHVPNLLRPRDADWYQRANASHAMKFSIWGAAATWKCPAVKLLNQTHVEIVSQG